MQNAEAYPQHDARDAIDALLQPVDVLESSFDSPDAVETWLRTENRYLGGLTPADAIRVGRIDRAHAAFEALESGIYL